MSNFYVFANNSRYTRGGVDADLCASDFHYTVRTDELPWERSAKPSAGLDYANECRRFSVASGSAHVQHRFYSEVETNGYCTDSYIWVKL